MTHGVLAASQVLLFMASLYGWGGLVNRLCYGPHTLSGWAYPSALGIAALVAFGGLLNAAGIAKPMALLLLGGAGVGLAIYFVSRSFCHCQQDRSVAQGVARPDWNRVGNLVCLALILLVFFFLIMVLMPARTFNFHDDFHIYLMWPLRMLETGSLAGNPFDHIGVSALGAQSFMQGMYLALGELGDINAFDAILCLILLLGLCKELGDLLGIDSLFALAAGLLAIFINPHYVNVTSLYSGALMLLGLTYATVLLTRYLCSHAAPSLILAVVPCGLFYGALLALKTTYVFAVAAFWGVALLGSLLLVKERRQVLLAYLSCAGITTLLVLPWVSLYWGRYLQKIHDILNDIGYPHDTTTTQEVTGDVLVTLFSNEELFHGNTFRDYFLLVGMLLCISLVTGWITWKNKSRSESPLLIPFLAVSLSTVISYGLQYQFGPARLVVRYSCPMLIGAAPAAILVAGWFWTQGKHRLPTEFTLKRGALWVGGILLVAQFGLILIFRETFVARVQRAYAHRTLLSFPLAEDATYKRYNDYVLNGDGAKMMSLVQETVPAGEAIFAWVAMPLLFDFTRNPIYTINESGLAYNLLVMPLTAGVDSMRTYFRQYGIRYIILDYNGYGMKGPGELGSLQINLLSALNALAETSRVLFNDGTIIVYDIGHEK